jgi:hypothetical protein
MSRSSQSAEEEVRIRGMLLAGKLMTRIWNSGYTSRFVRRLVKVLGTSSYASDLNYSSSLMKSALKSDLF